MEKQGLYTKSIKKNNTINLNNYKKQKAKRKKKKNIFLSYLYAFLILSVLIISSFVITKGIYTQKRCVDLAYSVEHYFTTGFNKNDTLLRVQQMSLIYSDGENAMVEVSGLSKKEPHKKTTLKGNFKKNKNNSWILEEVY